MTIITDSADPRVKPYHVMTLRNPGFHDREGTFVADGDKVVTALLRSSAGIRSLFALPEFYETYSELIAQRRVPEEAQFTASPEVMENVTGFRHHSGVMAIGVQPPFTSLDTITLPAVALCGVINPDNVGVIARNCAGLGFRSLIIDGGTCSPYLRRAMRVSMGAALWLEVCRCDALLSTALQELRSKRGTFIVGAELTSDAVAPDAVAWQPNMVIVFGSEAQGISSEVISVCDSITAIPIMPVVQSLNVAAASAIMLYTAAERLRHQNTPKIVL